MRTTEEIVTRIRTNRAILDFGPGLLMTYLPYKEAESLMSEDKVQALEGVWEQKPLTRESVLGEIRDYMGFAWSKAGGHRGISASRSVDKMRAWVWLLGDEEKVDWDKYTNYGAPILKQVCELYDIPIPSDRELKNMSMGKSCTPNCQMGCGR